jgi:hypothetical protein
MQTCIPKPPCLPATKKQHFFVYCCLTRCWKMSLTFSQKNTLRCDSGICPLRTVSCNTLISSYEWITVSLSSQFGCLLLKSAQAAFVVPGWPSRTPCKCTIKRSKSLESSRQLKKLSDS